MSKPKPARVEQINIRMNAAERAQVEAAALVAGRTLSDWIRRVCLAASSLRRKEAR